MLLSSVKFKRLSLPAQSGLMKMLADLDVNTYVHIGTDKGRVTQFLTRTCCEQETEERIDVDHREFWPRDHWLNLFGGYPIATLRPLCHSCEKASKIKLFVREQRTKQQVLTKQLRRVG